MKAGYSRETATEQGYQLLQKTSVRDEIAKLKQNRLNREMIDASDIFQKYLDIAFADITDYVEFGREEVPVMGPFGPIKIEDPKTGEKVTLTKMINTVRFRESAEVDGTLISEVKQGKDGASVKLNDRLKAMDWLSSHMDIATEEQRAKVEYLKARTDILRSQKASEEVDSTLAAAIEEAYRNGHSGESD